MAFYKVVSLIILIIASANYIPITTQQITSTRSLSTIHFELYYSLIDNLGLLVVNITLSTEECEFHSVFVKIFGYEGNYDLLYYIPDDNMLVAGVEFENDTVEFLSCGSGTLSLFFSVENIATVYSETAYELRATTSIFKDSGIQINVKILIEGSYDIHIGKIGNVLVKSDEANGVINIESHGEVTILLVAKTREENITETPTPIDQVTTTTPAPTHTQTQIQTSSPTAISSVTTPLEPSAEESNTMITQTTFYTTSPLEDSDELPTNSTIASSTINMYSTVQSTTQQPIHSSPSQAETSKEESETSKLYRETPVGGSNIFNPLHILVVVIIVSLIILTYTLARRG